MEIHAPEGPIHSVRHFLIHLLTITVGILIALSLEGLNEWRHHRNLVHEAQSNLANELHDNLEQQRAIANVLAAIASTQGQNPERAPRADVERAKQQIQTALVDIMAEEQLGKGLLRTYDEALAEPAKASH
jgi:hypothetical protein